MPLTVVSALKAGSPNAFVANDNGFATMASDCNVELHKTMALVTRFDSANNGNVVQCRFTLIAETGRVRDFRALPETCLFSRHPNWDCRPIFVHLKWD